MPNLHTVTRFDRNEAELQEFWVFCIFSSGRDDETAKVMTRRFLTISRILREPPFDVIRNFAEADILGHLLALIRCEDREQAERALVHSLPLKLTTCSRLELLQVEGITPEEVDFFLRHTRLV